MSSSPQLLTDPFLQLPTETSVRVVWFTEFAGIDHTVSYGENLNCTALATTIKLSRTREDRRSHVGKQTEHNEIYPQPVIRNIWRHEAEVSQLTAGKRVPYRVTSVREDGETVSSDIFTLAAAPPAGMPIKILLTSDHQLMPMTAANLQKVEEEVGILDAVFFAGDLVNIPDRASEWFDDRRGNAFFPCLQGRANYEIIKHGIKTLYAGGKIIQNAPLFPAIGNHETMGRFSDRDELREQLYSAFPLAVAEEIYNQKSEQINPSNHPEVRQNWLIDNSFNNCTYEEIFSLPAPQKYYAVTLGDVRLVVAHVACVWRTPSLAANAKGRYREREEDFNNPEEWGYGQHIFEPIKKGSTQYNWLEKELKSSEFKNAKYKIVMFHHPAHTLGENIVPAFTDPVQIIDRNSDGSISSIRYEYPKHQDYLVRDVIPLLENAGVQLVLFGHSHLWNRFISTGGINFLETSNVGNSYGAFLGDKQRNNLPIDYQEEYVASGDPNQLEPIVPNIEPLIDEDGKPMPYIASNDFTVFSILDTETGTVSSYHFDIREPQGKVVKFDEFKLVAQQKL